MDVITTAGREAWRMLADFLFAGQVAGRFQDACSVVGVAPGAFKLLNKMEPGVGVPMRDFADRFGFDASYVTTLADALEERGWVERRAHPTDRRVKMLVITPAGIEAKQRAYESLYEPPPMFESLTAAEQRELRDLLRKVMDADGEAIGPRRVGAAAAR
jgi:MarR family transcriptional regulator, organic hydroperoxide resistance regulator